MQYCYYRQFDDVPTATIDYLKNHLTLKWDGTMYYRIKDWEEHYVNAIQMPGWFRRQYPTYRQRLLALSKQRADLRIKSRHIIVATHRKTPVGWTMTDDFDHINLFVDGNFRRQGIATRLASEWLAYNDVQTITTWNPRARKTVLKALEHRNESRKVICAPYVS